MRHSLLFYACLVLHASLLPSSHLLPQISIPIDINHGKPQKDSYVPYCIEKRPRIGLALSGGGARGLAQIGVLKVLEKNAIPVDAIAGTSIGALVGGLFASGYTAAQIESLANKIVWDDIIKDAPPRKQLFLGQKEEKSRSQLQIRFNRLSLDFKPAYTSGQKLTMILNETLLNAPYPTVSSFDDLQIPLRIVCTDILTGKKVVLDRGSLADAMRASMAIPLLFTPLAYGDSLLMDGGLVENIPATDVKALGVDLVIAVDTSSKLRNKNTLKAPWEVADQVTTIMQQEQVRHQRQISDLVIVPELGVITNTDFRHIDDMIRAGEIAATKALPIIETILSKFDSSDVDTAFKIRTLSLNGLEALKPEFILSDIEIDTTRPINLKEIRWIAQAIYQTGYFSQLSAQIDTSKNDLIFAAIEYPKVRKIVFYGNTVYADSILTNLMETKTGKILNFQGGRRDLTAIISMYHRSGYALARIDEVRFRDGNLEIFLNEGRLSSIVLNGNLRTKPFVVMREVPLKKGDLFQVPLLKQGLENIYSTGYFEGVRFKIDSDRINHTLTFTLLEQGYTLFRSGFHIDNERKTQGHIEIAEENLLGYGIEGSFIGLLGAHDQSLSAEIRTDRLFKTFVTSRFNASYQKRDYPYYENDLQIGKYRIDILDQSILLGQQMRRLGTLSLQLKNEYIHLFPMDGRQNTPKESLDIRSIVIKSEVDTRDKMPYPQSGKYHILEYETGLPFLGSHVSYFKFFSSMESYYPFTKNLTFRPRIHWGTADLTTPFAKQYHLGGMDSFLGFHEDALVGKRFIAAIGELRLRLPKPSWIETYLSLRYNLGGIWGSYSKISINDFKHGIGLILSINTPIGPVQTGYGRANNGRDILYLSVGYRI